MSALENVSNVAKKVISLAIVQLTDDPGLGHVLVAGVESRDRDQDVDHDPHEGEVGEGNRLVFVL